MGLRHKLRRYILTGAPGAGKTSVLNCLKDKGFNVIKEAATDLILESQSKGIKQPWLEPDFINKIWQLQTKRQLEESVKDDSPIFYDRTPIDTYALSVFLNIKPSRALLSELERIEEHGIYNKEVFLLDGLGFIENNEIRQISYNDALIFGNIHEEVYTKFGYKCIKIPALGIDERTKLILDHIK